MCSTRYKILWELSFQNKALAPSHAVLRLLDIFDKGFSYIESIYDSKPVIKKKKNSSSTFTTEKLQTQVAAKSKH
jgi:hypothetical protein